VTPPAGIISIFQICRPQGPLFFLEKAMNVYVDESGDLGFKFNKPNGKGGSSRYLTIAFLLVPPELSKYPKRIVRSLYNRRKHPPSKELKGSMLNLHDKVFFAEKVIGLLKRNRRIKILAITVNKRRVQKHIRQDANKLYNYMIALALPEEIKKEVEVKFIPDKRSIKVKSGNSLADYLQVKLWFEFGSKARLINIPRESHQELNLQFIDFISNIVWHKYENSDDIAFKMLAGKIRIKELFF